MKILAKSSTKDYGSYNAQQTEVGHKLYTLKGSPIARSSKYGVGKEIGGDIYFHKSYADKIVPESILQNALEVMKIDFPEFHYNTMRYSPKTGVISFQECPDFRLSREPKVGDYINVAADGTTKKGHSEYIFHHKWLWVMNNYRGFNVRKSWEWSKKWLSILQEPSDGNGIERWNAQLDRYNLEHDI